MSGSGGEEYKSQADLEPPHAQAVHDELSLRALQSLNGEEVYLLGLSSHILGFHQQALDCFDLAEKQDFLSKFVIFNSANSSYVHSY